MTIARTATRHLLAGAAALALELEAEQLALQQLDLLVEILLLPRSHVRSLQVASRRDGATRCLGFLRLLADVVVGRARHEQGSRHGEVGTRDQARER